MGSHLFKCNGFRIYSLNRRSERFLAGLSPRDWERFESVIELFTGVLLTGAPTVDRIEKVSGASATLYELKITPPGSKGPQQRVLCAVNGRKILCVRGIDKRQPRLRPQDVKAADKALSDYQRSRDERQGRNRRRREDPP